MKRKTVTTLTSKQAYSNIEKIVDLLFVIRESEHFLVEELNSIDRAYCDLLDIKSRLDTLPK